jgi:hypothetical protein
MTEKSKDFRDQWIAEFMRSWDKHRTLNYSKDCIPRCWTYNENGLLNDLIDSRSGYLEALQLMYMLSGNRLKEFDIGNIED